MHSYEVVIKKRWRPLVVPWAYDPPAYTLYTSATAQSVCVARFDTKKPHALSQPSSAVTLTTKTEKAPASGDIKSVAGSADSKLARSPSAEMHEMLSPRSVAHDEAVKIADQFVPTLHRLCDQVASLETALQTERSERKAEIADLRLEHAAALGDQMFASALADMLPFLQKNVFQSGINKTLNDLLLHASGSDEKAKTAALNGLKTCPLSDITDPLLLAFKSKGQRNKDRHYILDNASTNTKIARIAYLAWALQTGDPTGEMEADVDSVSQEWSVRPDLCMALGNRLKRIVTTGDFANFAPSVEAFFKYLESQSNTFCGYHMFNPKFVHRHCSRFLPPDAPPITGTAPPVQRPINELMTLAEVDDRLRSESNPNAQKALAARYKLLLKQKKATK